MNYQPDMIVTALKLIAALGVVLAMIYGAHFLSRRFVPGKMGFSRGNPIRLLASSPIGVKKTVCMVAVPGTVLVLGVTQDRIALLTELDPTALPDTAAPAAGDPPAAGFADQLARLTGRVKGDRA